MSPDSVEYGDSFVTPAQSAEVAKLAVGTEVLTSVAESLIANSPGLTDSEALVLGILAHLAMQQQRMLEISAGFRKPILVEVDGV